MDPSKAHILIAEDDKTIRQELQYAVSHSKPFFASVTIVGNGEEAVEIIRTQAIDIVILDWDMPKLDGASALEMIRQIKPEMRAIFYTGSDIDHGFAPRNEGKHLANKYKIPVLVKSHISWMGLVAAISVVLADLLMVFPDR